MAKLKYNIEDMQKLAKSKGGNCLSKEYIGNRIKLKWNCNENHKWTASPSNILRGTWCPYCIGRCQTIKDMQCIAKKRGGECLSKKYINAITKLKWKCKFFHIWHAKPCSIKDGTWCPYCKGGISERICRGFFEKIFNEKFPKKRYDWLLSPKNSKLELDGYNERLKIAFEYQGRQHYVESYFNKKKLDLKYIQQCDKIKRDKCKEKGITLIEIPHSIKYNNMEKYILNKLKSNIPFQNLKYKEWNIYFNDEIDNLKKIAITRDGECLSNNYINAHSKLKFRCNKDKYEWFASPGSIKDGSWCPICGRTKKATINDCQKVAQIYGGQCLSKKYINDRSKLKWICKEKHKWSAIFNPIRNKGVWCPTCGHKKSWETRRKFI